jgi:hypothetical protein
MLQHEGVDSVAAREREAPTASQPFPALPGSEPWSWCPSLSSASLCADISEAGPRSKYLCPIQKHRRPGVPLPFSSMTIRGRPLRKAGSIFSSQKENDSSIRTMDSRSTALIRCTALLAVSGLNLMPLFIPAKDVGAAPREGARSVRVRASRTGCAWPNSACTRT